MRHQYRLVTVFSLFLFSACSYFPSMTADQPLKIEEGLAPEQIRSLLTAIDNRNKTLKKFKGIGKLTLWEKGRKRVDERAAWVCSEPVSIRLAILAAGNPILRVAGNGEYLYVQGYRDNQVTFDRIRTSDPSLKSALSVPLKISEVIRILSGRLPSGDYRWTTVEKRRDGSGYLLTAEKWSGNYQKVSTGGDRGDIEKIALFDFYDALRYSITFTGMHDQGPYRVPETIAIFNPAGKIFELQIDQYMTDIAVSPEMFELAIPGEKRRE